MREKILKTLAKMHARYPWRMLAGVALLTVIFAFFAYCIEHHKKYNFSRATLGKLVQKHNFIVDCLKNNIE